MAKTLKTPPNLAQPKHCPVLTLQWQNIVSEFKYTQTIQGRGPCPLRQRQANPYTVCSFLIFGSFPCGIHTRATQETGLVSWRKYYHFGIGLGVKLQHKIHTQTFVPAQKLWKIPAVCLCLVSIPIEWAPCMKAKLFPLDSVKTA